MAGACFLLYMAALAQVASPETPLVFPHFAQGGGYQTVFTLSNLSKTATTATVQLFLPSGALSNTISIAVAANGTARTSLTGSALTVGWARITTSPVAGLSASETIQLSSGGVVFGEAGVLPSIPDTALRLPVFEKDGVATGVAIANPGSTAATLTLTLRNPNGSAAGTQALPLGPSQQTARFVSELFSGLSGFEGSLEITSPVPVSAFALRQHTTGTFSALGVAAASSTTLESFFSPNGGTAARIVQEIERTQTSIDIAIYSFTRNEIADALIAAKNRGVAIRIIADSGQAPGSGSEIARLEAAGFRLKRTAGISGSGIMHNKYAIFDGGVLLTGSYNWSTNAEENSFENAMFIRNAAAISAYQVNFDAIWNTR